MIPIYQTIFDNKKGDCYAACIASIFEIPLESVPKPNGIDDDFWPIYHEWFAKYNARVISVARGDFIPPDAYLVGTVKSPRFKDTDHAVVIYGNKVVHDPHPDRTSERDDLSEVFSIDFIFPIDPSKPMEIK